MWTIGRSQRVEEKKYRPIVRKIRYKLTSKVHNYRTKINENKEIKDIQ